LAPLFTFQELQDAKKKPKGKGIGTRDPSASTKHTLKQLIIKPMSFKEGSPMIWGYSHWFFGLCDDDDD
jgi:hypothetical protein